MTDTERVLEALRTGPKTAAELYALNAMVHSRVSDLRRRGHEITCKRVPGANDAASYLYTLVSPLDAPDTHAPEHFPRSVTGGESGASSGEAVSEPGCEGQSVQAATSAPLEDAGTGSATSQTGVTDPRPGSLTDSQLSLLPESRPRELWAA